MPVLYHYCSTAAFHSIVSSRSLWLSSLRQSNDTSEGRIVSQSIARLSAKDELPEELKDHLLAAVANMEGLYDGLGICLSCEGDLLSQWRAYTCDGSGVSIGFDKDYLDWLVDSSRGLETDLTLNEVRYDPDIQDDLVAPAYAELRRLLESAENFPPGQSAELQNSDDPTIVELNGRLAVLTLLEAAMSAFGEVFSLKHRAFAEEREWRLLHHFGWEPTSHCLYRTAAGKVVPYKVCELREVTRAPIAELILGPRHTTPVPVMENYLAQHGFDRVNVKRSEAPYR